MAALVALCAPLAAAQDDPALNESDYDTDVPEEDDSYLRTDETTGTSSMDPTLEEDDFDTTLPPPDDAYLDDEAFADAAANQPQTPRKGTPAPAALLGLAAAALVFRRR